MINDVNFDEKVAMSLDFGTLIGASFSTGFCGRIEGIVKPF
jgi:hypothetical protein